MKTYKDMTKEELIKTLKELSSEQNIKQSAYEDTLHELEAHQIELETQNIELQESRKELEESSNRYALLYDFAPVGYCTLDKKGIIREINLTGAKMLGVERNRLAGMPFNMFISEGDMEKFFSHLKKCKEQIEKVSTELCLKEKNGQITWIELLSSPMEGSEELMFQTVITDVTEHKQLDDLLTFLAQCGSKGPGEEFFKSLAHYLALSLGMDFVCIDRLEGDGLTARTVAVWCDGRFEDNVSYALKDTPCGDVVGKTVCCFPARVCQFFPRDKVLQDLRAESYVGVTLWSYTGQPVGIIAVIGRHKLKNRPLAETILKTVAVRAGAEMERLTAEEALRKSEHFAHSTVDAIPAHLAVLDERGSIVFVNRSWRSFAQANSPEGANLCEGANYLSVCDTAYGRFSEGAREFAAGIRAVLQGNQEEFSLEYPCHSPDEERWFIGRVTRFPGEGTIHLVVTHVSITERKQADEALIFSETRYRRLFEAAKDGILILSLETGKIIDVNQFLIDLLGYSKEQFIEKAIWEIGCFKDIIANKDKFLELQQMGFVRYENLPLETALGRKINVEFVSNVYLIGHHEVIQCNIRDITERRQAEEEQKKLQDQLFQAQKMESVGRLAGGVAHDFNNLLGIIMGYAEIIMMDMEPDNPVYSHLKQILNTTQKAAELTRQLLAFARKQTAIPKILDMNETVANMLKMLQRIISENIDLIWRPGHDIWNVRIDPVQIDQILANLTVNSRDAIPDTGSIALETANVVFDCAYTAGHTEFLPGEYVLLSVSDTGVGMSKGVMEHIFEPFFTTKETGKGTGLGLATVYGIVRQNNGFINVYSEEGKGTIFKIYLPRFKSDIVESKVEKVSMKPQRGTETLLITEDEEDYLMSCKMVLEKLGYTVLTAKTPDQAIHLAEEHPGDIDLLITDVIMPKMNGKELLEKIHNIRPGLKYLYMSGYTADVIAHHGVLEEGVNFLQKPFSVKTIAEKVREVLDSK